MGKSANSLAKALILVLLAQGTWASLPLNSPAQSKEVPGQSATQELCLVHWLSDHDWLIAAESLRTISEDFFLNPNLQVASGLWGLKACVDAGFQQIVVLSHRLQSAGGLSLGFFSTEQNYRPVPDAVFKTLAHADPSTTLIFLNCDAESTLARYPRLKNSKLNILYATSVDGRLSIEEAATYLKALLKF